MDMSNLFELARLHAFQIGILSTVVLVAVRLASKPHLAHVLLFVVLVKCLIPPVWASQFGVFCWFAQQDRIESKMETEPVYVSPRLLTDARYEPSVFDPTIELGSDIDEVNAAPAVVSGPTVPPKASRFDPLWALASVWISVSCLICIASIIRAFLCVRAIRRQGIVEIEAVQSRVQQLCKKLKLRRRVRVLISRGHIGPAVFGLLRPRIVIPNLIVQDQSDETLDAILTHELLHIRRGDLWVNLLQTLAKAVWWFHPLVWFVSRSISRTAEICCDEETIATLGCSPGKYARSLVNVLELKQTLRTVPSFPGIRPVEITAKDWRK